ncbi:MAG: outer membrane beta-barrel protein [Bacteroidales bacterium]|nr:outer membrane beta-barrel protein [Bacteroidales bacterium]MBP5613864.1 outer membrane beta-barrel protein [Bacteroidales bacterium]
MKKIAIIGMALLLTGAVTAQAQDSTRTGKESKHLIIKNRLFFDVFYSYWFGLPEGVKPTGVNRGFNASFIYDMPIRKESPFSFGLGVGVCSHNLYSNAYSFIDGDYNVTMQPFPEKTSYRINKLSFTYLHMPLEFRYINPNNEFKAAIGIRVGIIADVHSKYVGKNTEILQYQDNIDRDVRIKSDKFPNKTKIPVEVTLHTGWKYFDINASYMLTKMFEEGNPQVHPVSVGLTIAIY